MTGDYLFHLVSLSVIALIAGAISVMCLVLIFSEKDSRFIAPNIVSGVFAIICAIGTFATHKTGPDVEYTALVSDYNEVFEQGFEVVRHEGNLVILKERID